MSSTFALKMAGVTKSYRDGGRELAVLTGIDLTVKPGEVVAVLGRSGTGKSTMLHLLGLLDRQSSGEIMLGEAVADNLSEKKRTLLRGDGIGFVFQQYHLLGEFSAVENVALAAGLRADGFGFALVAGLLVQLLLSLGIWGYLGVTAGVFPAALSLLHWSPWLLLLSAGMATITYACWRFLFWSDRLNRAGILLKELGLEERAHHKPGKLSGGEQQRVAIARALINKPPLLLCDEPTGNLDPETGQQVLDLLWKAVRDRGTAMIMVTHDKEVALKADRIYRLENGECLCENT